MIISAGGGIKAVHTVDFNLQGHQLSSVQTLDGGGNTVTTMGMEFVIPEVNPAKCEVHISTHGRTSNYNNNYCEVMATVKDSTTLDIRGCGNIYVVGTAYVVEHK